MSNKSIDTTDDELNALMAELEEQNVALTKPAAAEPAKAEERVLPGGGLVGGYTPAPVKAEDTKIFVPETKPEPAPVVAAPVATPAEKIVDVTRKIWIHHPESCCVFRGTEADLVGDDLLVEITASEGVTLAKKYAADKAAAEKRAAEAALAKTVKAEREAVVPLTKTEDGKLSTPGGEPEPMVTPYVSVKQLEKALPDPVPEPAPSAGLKHYVDVNQFQKDTRVSDTTLDQCMIEQNSLRAYYGAQAANAEAQASRLKARFEVIEATLYDQHRKELAADPAVKATVQMVDSAVKMDPRWLKAKNQVIESETIASINKSMVESLKDRRDMIIQLGADRRDEYKGAARVMAVQNEREDLTARALAAGKKAA